jgi:hypothetical protein
MQDPFNLYTPSHSSSKPFLIEQSPSSKPVVINKAKIKFIKNTTESKQQKDTLDSSLTFTMKEVNQQIIDKPKKFNLSPQQKFDGGESPFKNLTTVNVV